VEIGGVEARKGGGAPPGALRSAIELLGLGVPRRPLLDPHALVALLAAVPVLVALRVLAPYSSGLPALVSQSAVALLFVQPAIEELLFRGLLQGALLRTRWGRTTLRGLSAANVVTSALFCVAHLYGQPPAWAAAVFVPSLIFGHLRERTGSVWPALVVHALYNAGFLLVVAGWGR
jgi:membrane protease YdiL (CAAX protease family)